MSLIFKTNPGRLMDIGILILRIGISFGFIWAGIGKVSDPVGFGHMLQAMVGIDPIMSTNMAIIIGTAELLSGVLILGGLATRPAAIFQIIILIGAMMMFGFDFTKGPAIWKDSIYARSCNNVNIIWFRKDWNRLYYCQKIHQRHLQGLR